MDYKDLYREEPSFEKHRRWISWIVDIVVIVVMAVFISDMFGQKVTVTGHSMEDALMQDEVVLINKMIYDFKSPSRGDIICFTLKDDQGEDQTYIKRIIGLPGETVQIKDGYVYIDGSIIDSENELYQASVAGNAKDEIVLGKEEYFVLGDNRTSSEDSRFDNIGLINMSQIKGKVWFRISPFEKMGRPSYKNKQSGGSV